MSEQNDWGDNRAASSCIIAGVFIASTAVCITVCGCKWLETERFKAAVEAGLEQGTVQGSSEIQWVRPRERCAEKPSGKIPEPFKRGD
jgi:hypothetical protein